MDVESVILRGRAGLVDYCVFVEWLRVVAPNLEARLIGALLLYQRVIGAVPEPLQRRIQQSRCLTAFTRRVASQLLGRFVDTYGGGEGAPFLCGVITRGIEELCDGETTPGRTVTIQADRDLVQRTSGAKRKARMYDLPDDEPEPAAAAAAASPVAADGAGRVLADPVYRCGDDGVRLPAPVAHVAVLPILRGATIPNPLIGTFLRYDIWAQQMGGTTLERVLLAFGTRADALRSAVVASIVQYQIMAGKTADILATGVAVDSDANYESARYPLDYEVVRDAFIAKLDGRFEFVECDVILSRSRYRVILPVKRS